MAESFSPKVRTKKRLRTSDSEDSDLMPGGFSDTESGTDESLEIITEEPTMTDVMDKLSHETRERLANVKLGNFDGDESDIGIDTPLESSASVAVDSVDSDNTVEDSPDNVETNDEAAYLLRKYFELSNKVRKEASSNEALADYVIKDKAELLKTAIKTYNVADETINQAQRAVQEGQRIQAMQVKQRDRLRCLHRGMSSVQDRIRRDTEAIGTADVECCESEGFKELENDSELVVLLTGVLEAFIDTSTEDLGIDKETFHNGGVTFDAKLLSQGAHTSK